LESLVGTVSFGPPRIRPGTLTRHCQKWNSRCRGSFSRPAGSPSHRSQELAEDARRQRRPQSGKQNEDTRLRVSSHLSLKSELDSERHPFGVVAESVALLRDVPDTRPRKVISQQAGPVFSQHRQILDPTLGGLFWIGIVGEFGQGLLQQQTGWCAKSPI